MVTSVFNRPLRSACVDSACARSPKGSKLTSGRYVLLSVHTRACHQPLQQLGIQLGETPVLVQMKLTLVFA